MASRMDSVCNTVDSSPTCSEASSLVRLDSSSPRSCACTLVRRMYWKMKITTAARPTAPTPVSAVVSAMPAVSSAVANSDGSAVTSARST